MASRDGAAWPLAECCNCKQAIGHEAELRWCDNCEAHVCPNCWLGSFRIEGADIKLCNQRGHVQREGLG